MVSVHHDHNRNEKRAITAMVYLSELEVPVGGGEAGGPGGETFFPCSNCDADDPLLKAFEGLLKEGIHIINAPDPHGVDDGDLRSDAVYQQCVARLHKLRARGRGRSDPPGVIRGKGEYPGLLISPRLGRVVVFEHVQGVMGRINSRSKNRYDRGSSAAASAFHAPCTIAPGTGQKWTLTSFRVPPSIESDVAPSANKRRR